MTVKSLFNIILKVIGIVFIQNIIGAISTVYSISIIYTSQFKIWSMFFVVIGALIALIAYILLSFLLIFKTSWVIRLLKLERDFDEETLPLNINGKAIISIAIVVIAGCTLIWDIPNLFQQLTNIMRMQMMPALLSKGTDYYTYSNLLLVIGKIVLSVLLIIFRRRIETFIGRSTVNE